MSSHFPFLSEMSKINFLKLLQVFMGQMMMVIEGFYGMNWWVWVVGGTYHGALGVISMLGFPSKNQARPITIQPCWSFLISFRSSVHGYSSGGQFFYVL